MTVELAAVASVWSKTSLDEPAAQVWHIDFDHQDKEALHNFTIASGVTTRPADLPVEQRVFQSKSYRGGTYTIDVPAFPAGSYTFWCTIHPVSMLGTLTLK